ncbi:MAG: mandelate racemase/muconate lactonizing enzyme family protein [Bacteroidota bacterium]
MKIKNIYFKSLELKLKESYTIAYETFSSCTNIFMMAETAEGIKGLGCGSPDSGVTGETPGKTMDVIEKYIEPLLKNADPFDYTRIMEELRKNIPGNPSALAMTDMLLYDLISKKAGVPLYKYLGAYRKSMPTSITIGIMPVEETIDRARNYYHSGFRILKLKGGRSCEEDIEKIARIRKEFGDEIQLRVDANQGYTVEEAVKFVEKTRTYTIELLEQPTPRDNYEALGRVSKKVAIPVMADESIMNLKDVFSLTKNDLTDMINIKLMKSGGIAEALRINAVASAAKVEAMIGCMDESEVSISAGLHFALSRPNVIYADLDGHLDLMDDPAKGTLILKKGILYPNNLPGLGSEASDIFTKLF